MKIEGSVPVAVVARVYGKSIPWIRMAIRQQLLPIGFATKLSQKRTNYYISPKKLYEDTGYEWEGEQV